MELDKQQIKRLRERHHRRHGIRPAHSEAMENATRFLKQAFNIREGRAPYHVIRKRFVNGARLTGSHLCILIIAMLIAFGVAFAVTWVIWTPEAEEAKA